MKNRVLAVILAGGKGERLDPLTRDQAKPAVPFGGAYRIIDFTLSNCYNSGLRKLFLLTQYKSTSLGRHVQMGWSRYFCREMGEFLDVVPPQHRIDESWYLGTADAVYQNIFLIEKEKPDHVIVLAGDHIYKMNYRRLVGFHLQNYADVTVSTLQVPVETARGQLGVVEVNAEQEIIGFEEKPQDPKTVPGNPQVCLASMGIYIFSAPFLYEELLKDAERPDSQHDFGSNIIPSLIGSKRIFSYSFQDENRKLETYWRDVGTLDAYYEANMDLVNVDPLLNLYDDDWPIFTYHPNEPPPKFVFAEEHRFGHAKDSLVCPGSIVSGGSVNHSILGHSVRINSFASVEESLLFAGVQVGRGAKIRKAIIDQDIIVPPGFQIGFDEEQDRNNGFLRTEKGVTIVSRLDGWH
ncbi:MAG: glucose-1-phosphate adenylyltransferase [Planctomycetaceae bacterium]|nr:glucose-1-phosphate adenylyltransferase [Planctomycetaceae bacterium]